jgi:hypothetical protein
VELTAGIDSLAEPYDLEPSLEILQTTRAVGFGNQQTDRIRPAVNGGNTGHDRSSKHG